MDADKKAIIIAAKMAVEHRHKTHHRMIKIHNGAVQCLTCGWKWPEQADMYEGEYD